MAASSPLWGSDKIAISLDPKMTPKRLWERMGNGRDKNASRGTSINGEKTRIQISAYIKKGHITSQGVVLPRLFTDKNLRHYWHFTIKQ
jgi:hypothetical protein